jgi:hypothetical protein
MSKRKRSAIGDSVAKKKEIFHAQAIAHKQLVQSAWLARQSAVEAAIAASTKVIHKRVAVASTPQDIEGSMIQWRRHPDWPLIEVADAQIGDELGVVRNIKTKRIISQHMHDGYKKLAVPTGNKSKRQQMISVHQLLCRGPKPTSQHTVDHIIADEKLNNLSSNLRWATTQQQNTNRKKHKTRSRHVMDYSTLSFRPIPAKLEFAALLGYSVSSTAGIVKSVTGRYYHGTKLVLGYIRFSTKFKGKQKNFYMHRLVAAAWCDDYSPDLIVNHISHDKSNNDAINLEWISRAENVQAAVQHGSIKSTSITQWSISNEKIATYFSMNAAARATGIDVSGIRSCAVGNRITAGGFVWTKTACDEN